LVFHVMLPLFDTVTDILSMIQFFSNGQTNYGFAILMTIFAPFIMGLIFTWASLGVSKASKVTLSSSLGSCLVTLPAVSVAW